MTLDQFWNIIEKVHAHAAGQTIVMITHDNGLAKIASRSVHIRDGEIVEDTSLAA